MALVYALEFSVRHGEAFAAPDDVVAGESCGPHAQGGEIAQRQQPEIGQHLVVAEHFGADHHGEGEAQEETQSKEPEAEWAEAAGQCVEKRPR